MIRSLLIAPTDAGALDRALRSAADAVVIDLAGADDRAAARAAEAVRAGGGRANLLVRMRPLDDLRTAADLATLAPARPHGFVLSGAEGGADVQRLGAMLAVEEAKADRPDGLFRIVAVAETSGALFGLNTFRSASDRLDAIGWDGEALARDLGAESAREGALWIDPCATARTLTLAAAADAGLSAIDGAFSHAAADAFRREAETARRDGFAAKFARDEAQVAVLNDVFGAR